MTKRIFVPTLVDAANLNAQVSNAREILADWDVPGWEVHALAYHAADPRVLKNPRIHVTRLWRRHAWYLHLFLCYLRRWDMIFYPGGTPTDLAALRWRRLLGFKAPVVVTLEGLVGDEQSEREYSALAGHPVCCQYVSAAALENIEQRNREATHIIAISPFLARMGQSHFGSKFSVLPLGINTAWFYRRQRPDNARLQIVSAGSVKARKRPQQMLQLARQFPDCDCIWYGEGDMRASLIREATAQGLGNLSFPGPLQPQQLGVAMRAADIFVLPSQDEGVPKVSQEAAACGLAQVIFGFYEAPSVIDGCNGFVVWDDSQFFAKVAELVANRKMCEEFGRAGSAMALAWDWQPLASKWRERLVALGEAG